MKLLVFSDLHQFNYPIPEIYPDMVLFLGDIPWQEVKRIDEYYSCPKFGVLGNHDVFDTYNGTNVEHVHAKTIVYKGLTLAGLDGCIRYNEKNTPQFTEDEANQLVSPLPKADLFLSHSNPKWFSVDRASHSGFQCLTSYILQMKPLYLLHGHLHQPYEINIDATTVVSVYPHLVFDL